MKPQRGAVKVTAVARRGEGAASRADAEQTGSPQCSLWEMQRFYTLMALYNVDFSTHQCTTNVLPYLRAYHQWEAGFIVETD